MMVNGYGGVFLSHDSRRSPKARDTHASAAFAPTDDASRGDADDRATTTTTMTVVISATPSSMAAMTTTRRARNGRECDGDDGARDDGDERDARGSRESVG